MEVLIDPPGNVTHASKAEEWLKTCVVCMCVCMFVYVGALWVSVHVYTHM